jgi:membrane carboxypeptidase/penicillin-binding protein PbpC
MVEQGGLKVTTTLDLDLQEEVQKIVAEEIENAKGAGVGNGAALVMDPQSGEILAMIGSKDYDAPDYDGKVNVTLSLRQPGSAIKPVTYVTAFKKGYTPASLIMDVQTPFPGGVGKPDYMPANYDGKYHGPLQIRYALGSSINVPAVKWLALIKVKEMLRTAYEMGLTTLEPTDENIKRLGLSVTLGGGEVRLLDLVTAYSAFANSGFRVEPVSILKVLDNKEKTLEEKKYIQGKRILSEELTFLINHILSDNEARLITFGRNSLINVSGYQVPVKTGTTDDKRDNWTVGWNKKFIVGVWVGNNDNTPMKNVASGVTGAAPIWRRIVYGAIKRYGAETYPTPGGIVMADVDVVSGFRAHDGYPSRAEYFIRGTEPTGDDSVHTKLKICKAEGKLATPSDIEKGDYEEKEYFVFKEDDPLGEATNKWQEAIDAWTGGQEDSRYHPPKDYCGTASQIIVKIREPGDKVQVGNEVTVKVEVKSLNKIQDVTFYVDDKEVTKILERPYEVPLTLVDGRHTISVKAKDVNGNEGNTSASVGVNVPWESPTPSSSSSPTPTPSETPMPT